MQSAGSIRLCEGLTNMIKMRANAEEEYAKHLTKIANQSASYMSPQDGDCESTFRDCIEHLRADMLNKAVQVSIYYRK